MPEGRSINPNLKRAVALKCNARCQSCGEQGEFFPDSCHVLGQKKVAVNFDCTIYRRVPMEYDHIIPLFQGGKTELSNLQILCRKCNRSKGWRT